MLTPTDIAAAFRDLELAGLRKPDAWTIRDKDGRVDLDASRRALSEAISLWGSVLGDLTGQDLRDAVRRHLATPKAGEFWPQPAHLLAGRARRHLADEHVLAWTRITANTSAARYGRAADLGLSDVQRSALAAIGGCWEIGQATAGVDHPEARIRIAELRKRFLDLCADGEGRQALALAAPTEATPALPANVLAFIGGPDPHADERRRRLDGERRADLRTLAKQDSREAVFRDRADGDAPYDLGAK
jgi:hypothetical protein